MSKKIGKFIISMLLCSSVLASTSMMAACEFNLGNNSSSSSTASSSSAEQTKQMEVIFVGNRDGATEPDAQMVNVGDTATEPEAPVCDGYDFIGWFTDEACTEEFDFNTGITEDMGEDGYVFLYAGWVLHVDKYIVSFETNGGNAIAPVEVESGSKVAKPEDPTKENCKFGGWFMDEACQNAFSFDASIEATITVYAKWINLYTVTFETNGGSAIAAQTVEEGKAPQDYETAKDDYIFAGWYTDAELTNAYTGGAITANTTLYAKWAEATAKTYKYTFNYNYSGAPAAIVRELVEGSLVQAPEVTNGDSIFAGWYKDAACTVEADLSVPAAEDLTFYAKWIEAVTVTFDFNYDGAPADVVEKMPIGSTLAQPNDPIRVGNYTFAGWSTAENGLLDVTFGEAVTESVTYYAQWKTLYVFEAEDVDLTNFFGFGFSGSAEGTSCIFKDESGAAAASNGYFITCMNNYGCSIEFNFTSDRAIQGVEFTIRLSAEVKDITIYDSASVTDPETDAHYKILVNNNELMYESIEFVDVPPQSDNVYMAFEDYTFTVDIVEGMNTIKLVSDNTVLQGGTMNATAPMVDCIKFDTYAELVFQKKDGNY